MWKMRHRNPKANCGSERWLPKVKQCMKKQEDFIENKENNIGPSIRLYNPIKDEKEA